MQKSESEAVAAVVCEQRALAEGKAAALSLCCWCGFPVGCVPVALLVPLVGHQKVFQGGNGFCAVAVGKSHCVGFARAARWDPGEKKSLLLSKMFRK